MEPFCEEWHSCHHEFSGSGLEDRASSAGMLTKMKPGLLALVALAVAASAATADGLLLHVPAVRNGWWAAIPLALALGLAVVAICRRRAWTTIAPAILVFLLGGIGIGSHFLPVSKAPSIVKQGDAFPDLRLAAHDGTKSWLSDRWRRAPLVVVMFRGGW
jgi:hypothetical protein